MKQLMQESKKLWLHENKKNDEQKKDNIDVCYTPTSKLFN